MAIANLCNLAEHLSTAEIGEFVPKPFYEPSTDALIFYARNERSYGKRMNESLTLFLSLTDRTLVGVEIKGYRRLAELARDSFKVVDNDVPLEILVSFARAPLPDDPELEKQYASELRQVGKGVFVSQTPACAEV